MRLQPIIVLTMGITLSVLNKGSWSDEVLIKQFSRDYPASVKKLEQSYQRIRGKYTTSTQTNFPTAKSTHRKFFAVDHENQKISILKQESFGDKDNEEAVDLLIGNKKHFQIDRVATTNRYRLGAAEVVDETSRKFVKQLDRFIAAPYAIQGMPISQLMADASFNILSADLVKSNNHPCVKIRFEFGEQPKNLASIWFDENINWAIRHAEISPGSVPQAIWTYDVEYGETSDGTPQLRSVQETASAASITQCRIETLSFQATPPNEFTLAFYKLPDFDPTPKPLPSKRPVLFFYLLSISLFGFAVALLLRRLSKQSTAS